MDRTYLHVVIGQRIDPRGLPANAPTLKDARKKLVAQLGGDAPAEALVRDLETVAAPFKGVLDNVLGLAHHTTKARASAAHRRERASQESPEAQRAARRATRRG